MRRLRIIDRKCLLLRLATGIAAILFTPLAAGAQTYGLSDLPENARPSGLSLYLAAAVTGTLMHVCQSTDVVGRFAWYLREADGTLFDAKKIELGRSTFKYSGMPRVRVEAVWQDVKGGTVTAKSAGRGGIPAYPELEWRRYDVESHSDAGQLAEAQVIIRIGAWRTIPYAEPCDRTRADATVRSPFAATDLFFK